MNKTLSTLFEPNDRIWFGTETKFDDGRVMPLHFDTIKLSELNELTDLVAVPEFFAINPIKGNTRDSLSVTAYRNFLFESDSSTLVAQYQQILKLSESLPISTVTFSGGKSYHFIVSLQDTPPFAVGEESGSRKYSMLWRALASYITANSTLIPDPSTKDPARLTRTPNAVRKLKGTTQTAIDWKPRYISFEDLSTLVAPFLRADTTIVRSTGSCVDVASFEQALRSHKGLKNRLEHPHAWVTNENIYPQMFKLTMWAIDATGVSENIFTSYLQKRVIPVIIQKGYPREPLIGVQNAFLWGNT